jgi:hypothetical protein
MVSLYFVRVASWRALVEAYKDAYCVNYLISYSWRLCSSRPQHKCSYPNKAHLIGICRIAPPLYPPRIVLAERKAGWTPSLALPRRIGGCLGGSGFAGHQIILEVKGMQFFSLVSARSADDLGERRRPAIWCLAASGLSGHGPTIQHNPNSRSPPRVVLSPRRQVHCGQQHRWVYGETRPPLLFVRVFSGALLPSCCPSSTEASCSPSPPSHSFPGRDPSVPPSALGTDYLLSALRFDRLVCVA